jgi:hypothetical protein
MSGGALMRRRRTEHAEGGIGTTEQSDTRDDQGGHQQDAGGSTKYTHQTTPLPRRIGEDRPGLLSLVRVRLARSVRVVRLDHEASLGESGPPQGRKRGVSANQ